MEAGQRGGTDCRPTVRDILPGNLCFDLGHLSDHVADPVWPMQQTADPIAAADLALTAESRAFLHGWPYVLEAAHAQTGGKRLTGAQIGSLLFNLRYRFAFMSALQTSGSKLVILPDGTIPDSDADVSAVRSVLNHSSIADLQ